MGLCQLCGYITFQLPLHLCACLDNVMCHGRFLSRGSSKKPGSSGSIFQLSMVILGSRVGQGEVLQKGGENLPVSCLASTEQS